MLRNKLVQLTGSDNVSEIVSETDIFEVKPEKFTFYAFCKTGWVQVSSFNNNLTDFNGFFLNTVWKCFRDDVESTWFFLIKKNMKNRTSAFNKLGVSLFEAKKNWKPCKYVTLLWAESQTKSFPMYTKNFKFKKKREFS